ncbi:MAG: hypothetical protein FWE45_04635 [Firmicutes bacterium]|nr:hypothetical protein [Bacillota bacterium]
MARKPINKIQSIANTQPEGFFDKLSRKIPFSGRDLAVGGLMFVAGAGMMMAVYNNAATTYAQEAQGNHESEVPVVEVEDTQAPEIVEPGEENAGTGRSGSMFSRMSRMTSVAMGQEFGSFMPNLAISPQELNDLEEAVFRISAYIMRERNPRNTSGLSDSFVDLRAFARAERRAIQHFSHPNRGDSYNDIYTFFVAALRHEGVKITERQEKNWRNNAPVRNVGTQTTAPAPAECPPAAYVPVVEDEQEEPVNDFGFYTRTQVSRQQEQQNLTLTINLLVEEQQQQTQSQTTNVTNVTNVTNNVSGGGGGSTGGGNNNQGNNDLNSGGQNNNNNNQDNNDLNSGGGNNNNNNNNNNNQNDSDLDSENYDNQNNNNNGNDMNSNGQGNNNNNGNDDCDLDSNNQNNNNQNNSDLNSNGQENNNNNNNDCNLDSNNQNNDSNDQDNNDADSSNQENNQDNSQGNDDLNSSGYREPQGYTVEFLGETIYVPYSPEPGK